MLFCCEKLLSFLFVKTGRNTSRNNSSIHQAFLPCWLRWLLSVYDCSCEHWHWARLPATEHSAAKSSRRMRHWRVLGAIWCLITGEWRCRCVSMGHAVSSRSAGILSLVYIKHAATCHFLVVSGWQTTGLPMSTGHVGDRLSTSHPNAVFFPVTLNWQAQMPTDRQCDLFWLLFSAHASTVPKVRWLLMTNTSGHYSAKQLTRFTDKLDLFIFLWTILLNQLQII